MQRIGILGGTFDPPHLGHLILAEYAIEAFALSHLLFVPAADPPHKMNQEIISIEHRLKMLELAVHSNANFSISRVDVDRPGPHYTVSMVQIIQSQYPEAELYFVMGGDSFADLPNWDRPQQLMQLAKLAIMRRPPENIYPSMHEDVLPGLAERAVIINAPLLEISSTEIVNRLQYGMSVRYLVPQAVLAYITAHEIYKHDNSRPATPTASKTSTPDN